MLLVFLNTVKMYRKCDLDFSGVRSNLEIQSDKSANKIGVPQLIKMNFSCKCESQIFVD